MAFNNRQTSQVTYLNMSLNIKVALAQDFLANMHRIPSGVQSKILKWALAFQADPTASGINYEKIRQARDKNLRSVRIDQDWRGIVFKPDKGDVYVLMYVDKHDDAYRWADGAAFAHADVFTNGLAGHSDGVAVVDADPST